MRLTVRAERWPLRTTFTIARGSKTAADVVVVELADDGGAHGRGECVPYARYGETVAGVMAAIGQLRDAIERHGLDRLGLQAALQAGAARNALDCAFWDLAAKQAQRPVWQLAGLPEPRACVTAYTLSLDEPPRMEAAAQANADRPLLKIKLGGPGDLARLRAVRRGAPQARLIVDANEGWSVGDYTALAPELAGLGVALIEQPLPAADDAALAVLAQPVPVCADESCHVAADVPALADRYRAVNIKLDKAGGLTEAIAMTAAARSHGLAVMIGCMVGTSLGMAPALLLAAHADHVDLDGPLLLAADRQPGLVYAGSLVQPATATLWG